MSFSIARPHSASSNMSKRLIHSYGTPQRFVQSNALNDCHCSIASSFTTLQQCARHTVYSHPSASSHHHSNHIRCIHTSTVSFKPPAPAPARSVPVKVTSHTTSNAQSAAVAAFIADALNMHNEASHRSGIESQSEHKNQHVSVTDQSPLRSTAAPLTTSSLDVESIKLAKRQLRQQVQHRLASLSSDSISSQSKALTQRLIEMPVFRQAKAVCTYLSMPQSELQTDAIVKACFEQHKRVFVPRIVHTKSADAKSSASTSSSHMVMVEVHNQYDVESNCSPNKWQIREPQLTDSNGSRRIDALECDELSVMLLPLVACDADCSRLGHGKGYYDRFISQLHQARQTRNLPRVHLIGVALNEQIVDIGVIPMAQHDVRLDQILTPKALHFSSSCEV